MPVAELSPDPGQSGDAVGVARDEAITKPQSPLLMTTVNIDAAIKCKTNRRRQKRNQEPKSF